MNEVAAMTQARDADGSAVKSAFTRAAPAVGRFGNAIENVGRLASIGHASFFQQ